MMVLRKIQMAVDVEVYWRRMVLSSIAAEANSELAFVDMRFLQPQRAHFHGKTVPMRRVSSSRWGVNQGERVDT